MVKKIKPFIAEGSKISIEFPDGDIEIGTYNDGTVTVERDTYFYVFNLGNLLKSSEIKLKKIS